MMRAWDKLTIPFRAGTSRRNAKIVHTHCAIHEPMELFPRTSEKDYRDVEFASYLSLE